MGIFVIGFAWTALFFAIMAARSFWKLVPGLALMVSLISYAGGSFTENQTACRIFLYSFYVTIFISMLCVPYLIYKGYEIFERKHTWFR